MKELAWKSPMWAALVVAACTWSLDESRIDETNPRSSGGNVGADARNPDAPSGGSSGAAGSGGRGGTGGTGSGGSAGASTGGAAGNSSGGTGGSAGSSGAAGASSGGTGATGGGNTGGAGGAAGSDGGGTWNCSENSAGCTCSTQATQGAPNCATQWPCCYRYPFSSYEYCQCSNSAASLCNSQAQAIGGSVLGSCPP